MKDFLEILGVINHLDGIDCDIVNEVYHIKVELHRNSENYFNWFVIDDKSIHLGSENNHEFKEVTKEELINYLKAL